MTLPAVSGASMAHLDKWVIAAVVALAAASALRAGCLRLACGPRRPRLPFAVRIRLRMRPGPGWAGPAGGSSGARTVCEFASTFAWDIVRGCEDVSTAVRRAGYMVEAVAA